MGEKVFKVEKGKRFFLDKQKIYIIEKGKVVIRNVFPNGMIVPNEAPLEKGDIIGDFFKICNVYQKLIREVEIEVEIIEDGELIEKNAKELIKNLEKDSFGMLKNLINQMLKKHLINICHHIYNKNGYILSVLMLHIDEYGYVPKEMMSHEMFNLSRSQFFSTINDLKKEAIISKTKMGIRIDRDRAKEILGLEC